MQGCATRLTGPVAFALLTAEEVRGLCGGMYLRGLLYTARGAAGEVRLRLHFVNDGLLRNGSGRYFEYMRDGGKGEGDGGLDAT